MTNTASRLLCLCRFIFVIQVVARRLLNRVLFGDRPFSRPPGAETLHVGETYYEPEEDSLLWYKKMAKQREGLADDARADAGETELKIGQSLRMTWMAAQRLDKELMGILRTNWIARATGSAPTDCWRDK